MPVGPHAAASASSGHAARTTRAARPARAGSGADVGTEEFQDDVVRVEVVGEGSDGVGGQVLIAVGPGVAAAVDSDQLHGGGAADVGQAPAGEPVGGIAIGNGGLDGR